MALFVTMGIAIKEGGTKYHDSPDLPQWVFALTCFSVQWFSLFDCMDGQRARRLNVGTPVGRILDEAGDGIIYAIWMTILGYIGKLPPGWVCLGIFIINFPMWYSEVAHTMTGKLEITYGDNLLGPIEVEFIATLIFGLCGIFGVSLMETPLGFPIYEWVAGKHFFMALICFLFFLAFFDTLQLIFEKDKKTALYYSLNPIMSIAIIRLYAWFGTETYTEHYVIFNMYHGFAFAYTSYRLMMSNMTKSKFKILGLEQFLIMVPLFVHLTCSNKLERITLEPLASWIVMFAILIYFYSNVALLFM